VEAGCFGNAVGNPPSVTFVPAPPGQCAVLLGPNEGGLSVQGESADGVIVVACLERPQVLARLLPPAPSGADAFA